MYQNFEIPNEDLAPLTRGRDPALSHTGDRGRLLRVHRAHVAAAAVGEAPPVGPYLMGRIADSRTMLEASAALGRRGPKAPGPSQLRLDHLDSGEICSLCRALATSVREGSYRPGRETKKRIPKEGHPGQFREVTLQNQEDRLVGKSAQLILEPVVEREFSPFSFGFRQRQGPMHALATLLAFARAKRRWFWVSADIEKAFDRVPFARLLDACRVHFPDDVIRFIDRIAYTGKKRGERQGSPASPFLFNIFADQFLDLPWHRKQIDVPLFRYVDDLLVPCDSEAEGSDSYEKLAQLTTSAGTPLKGVAAESVYDLTAGQSIEWLGFLMRREQDRLAIRIGEKAWDRLGWRLAKAHLMPASPLRAVQIVRGWVDAMGPCFPFEDRDAAMRRVQDTAARLAFDEIPSSEGLLRRWGASHARWNRLYAEQCALLPSRLHALADYVRPNCSSVQRHVRKPSVRPKEPIP